MNRVGALRASISHGMGLIALVIVLALLWTQADPVRRQLATAARTRHEVTSDDDLYRLPGYVGGDWPIVAHLRSHFPPGTAVSIPRRRAFDRRIMHGFWFALLPDYPVRSEASLRITLRRLVDSHQRILVGGSTFALVDGETAQP